MDKRYPYTCNFFFLYDNILVFDVPSILFVISRRWKDDNESRELNSALNGFRTQDLVI